MPVRSGQKGPAHQRSLVEFVQDDSGDSDFEDTAAPRSSKKRQSIHRVKSSSNKRQKTRNRRNYSDEDIVDDSEDMQSEDEFTEEDEKEAVVLNPVTGRPTRTAVKAKVANYAESEGSSIPDEDDMDPADDVEESADELAAPITPKKIRSRMVVKLRIPSERLSQLVDVQEPRRRTRSGSVRATSEVRGTRRSARLSQEPEDLLELTTSGRARPMATKGFSRTGGKGLKAPAIDQPSMILEESQEDSAVVDAGDETVNDDINPMVDSIEETHEETSHNSPDRQANSDDDSEDDDPIPLRKRSNRGAATAASQPRSQSRSQKNKRSGSEDDYNPEQEEILSAEEGGKSNSGQGSKRKRASSDSEEEAEESVASEDPDELLAEVHELGRPKRDAKRLRMSRIHTDSEIQFDAPSRARRARPNPVNYNLLPEDIVRLDEQSDDARPAIRPPARGAPKGGPRGLFNMGGSFGGNLNLSRALPFGPDARAAPMLGDDSSDDEVPIRPTNLPGMTPLTPHVGAPQTHNADAGGAMGVGRVAKKDMTDITPLEVSPDIGFDKVGGLDDHINQLKEMVMLPLLYPELYSKWKIPPPRGVLFHGPPGTGKTLLARALASSVTAGDKKVTFFMRKGADVMSKWVGEAERQLRLLFDEAKKQQPAIIFFDEFDGLAPVRSSKQEQIHASIVTTLLALMDGMDARGQIVVIGATNRPDSIDPAFRHPGRFDREFYFPLPSRDARRSIIDIHTRGWEPALEDNFKNELADKTRGYGGSDLRALCTEAVINAVQRSYPQIYKSDKKLEVDTSSIKVIAKDFLLSMRKITPSSERQTAAVAEPLPKKIEPLLRNSFKDIVTKLNQTIPSKRKHLTALEEAEYEDMDDASGFDAEELLRAFERGRIFRPRLLIKGPKGMGQKYLAGAVLQHLEGFFVRNLDLSTLFSDPANPPETILSSAFKEVRIHQPRILFIPQINSWYRTVGDKILETFSSLLRTLAANDAVLLLGIVESETVYEEPDPKMMRDLFGFSTKHEYRLHNPDQQSRLEFFTPLISYVRKRPTEFPDRDDRKKRKLPELPLAKEVVKEHVAPTKEELKAQYKADRSILNMLRLALGPVMREVKDKWRGLTKSVILDRDIEYLIREQDPNYVSSDLTEEQHQAQQMLRPFELSKDKHGNVVLRETTTNKFYYNCNTQIVEQRLSNGYYKRPKEFLFDLKTIAKDHATTGVHDKIVKANDMYGWAMAECELIEMSNPTLIANCEAVYKREQEREKLQLAEADAINAKSSNVPHPAPVSTVPSGPIQLSASVGLGIPMPQTPGPPNDDSRPHDSHHTNGETVPSRQVNDIADAMDIDESSSGSRPQFPAGYTVTPSNPTTYQQSQQSGPTQKIAPGSHLNDLRNSASTTTSGNKTSERTSRGSDPRGLLFRQTQSTNGDSTLPDSWPSGTGAFPDFDSLLPPIDGSQLPDTQSTNSKNAALGEGQHQSSNGTVDPSQDQAV